MKTCSKCNVEKDYSFFNKRASCKDGYRGECKDCNNNQAREWRKNNPDKVRETTMEWRKKNADKVKSNTREYNKKNAIEKKEKVKEWRKNNQDKVREARKEWNKNNQDKVRESLRQWYKKNADKVIEASKEWCKNNADKSYAIRANQRARKRNAGGSFTRQDVLNLWDKQRGVCLCCRGKMGKHFKESNYHVDHIVPLSKGGSNWPYNLQLLCPTCNMRKSSKLPEDFAREQGRLFI